MKLSQIQSEKEAQPQKTFEAVKTLLIPYAAYFSLRIDRSNRYEPSA